MSEIRGVLRRTKRGIRENQGVKDHTDLFFKGRSHVEVAELLMVVVLVQKVFQGLTLLDSAELQKTRLRPGLDQVQTRSKLCRTKHLDL